MTTDFAFVDRLRAVSDRDAQHMREHFVEPALSLDPDDLGDHTFFPLEMTWFYGEPVWEAMSDAQRLMLNRLTFCQSYFSTAVAEARSPGFDGRQALELSPSPVRHDLSIGFSTGDTEERCSKRKLRREH